MGILQTSQDDSKTPKSTTKRKSIPTDFSSLGPLHTFGTVGFSGYRDSASKQNGKRKVENDEMDSDLDDEDVDASRNVVDDIKVKEEDKSKLSPEDAAKQEKLAEGVRQIKVPIYI